MTKKEISDDVILAYALKNAIEHNGKCVVGSVISGLFAEGLEKSEIKDIAIRVGLAVDEVNKMSNERQEVKFSELEDKIKHRKVKEEGELIDLPDGEKGVVMRSAPSASGPLHLMHAINVSLNYLFVEKYGGKLYVRIEDTNPENIYPKSYKMIEQEAKWLTDGKAEIVIQSDRMDLYYKYAEKLINLGKAYICSCNSEKFKALSDKKKACPCRDVDKKYNIEKWKQMLDGSVKEGEAVLRFKSDIKHKNPAMRDFPLARINETKHPRVGNKYRVWPLMNLAVSVDDIEMKMTHIIRGKDHKDNAKRQAMIYTALGKKAPWVGFTGMTNFTDMKFSTSQMRKDIEEGKVKGWDDVKLPTVASLKKQGYKPEAFRGMAAHTGNLSEVDKVISKKDFFKVLDGFNR